MELPNLDLRPELRGTAYESLWFLSIQRVFAIGFLGYLLHRYVVGYSPLVAQLFLLVVVPAMVLFHAYLALSTAPRIARHWLPSVSYSLATAPWYVFGVVWPVEFLRKVVPIVYVLAGFVTVVWLIASFDAETAA
ncbi:hypothetical protein [Haloarchaeobius salinus]|uniref:hypothetical protein n=1 Tax=Haloarchaeobius salinus TaxID=1198298 RepID=UPI00210A3CC2|nr:hypothetical protein [Haloarchaeobius salinus]